LLLLLGLERKVDVHPLLRERQGRHEDDQQHEEHVDERRDVHVRTGVRNLAADDLFGAVVRVSVLHYRAPPEVLPSTCLGSVMSAMFSICALRNASMAVMIASYFASLSPLR